MSPRAQCNWAAPDGKMRVTKAFFSKKQIVSPKIGDYEYLPSREPNWS